MHHPVAAQLAQQARGEQRVAILGAFALLHPDGHARRVDVAHLQMTQLRDPQPRPVGGHQHGAVLGIGGQLDQARDLFARQDLGQLLRLARARDLELRLRLLERDVVAELQRVDRDVAAAPGKLALLDQVQQVALHLHFVDLLGAAPVVLRHRRHRAQVRLARALGHPAHHHVIVHLLAQGTHLCLLRVIAGPFPRDHADTDRSTLLQQRLHTTTAESPANAEAQTTTAKRFSSTYSRRNMSVLFHGKRPPITHGGLPPAGLRGSPRLQPH